MADSRTRALRRLNCETKGAVLPPLSHSSQVWLPVEKWEKCVITIISRYNCTTVFFARGDNLLVRVISKADSNVVDKLTLVP
jgi:hypothetical protein